MRDAAFKAVAVVPNDATDLPDGVATFGLFVVATGNVVFHDAAGNAITLSAVAANTRLPIQAKRVLSTGTTATVRALY